MGKFRKASAEENIFENYRSKYSTVNYVIYSAEMCDYMDLHI